MPFELVMSLPVAHMRNVDHSIIIILFNLKRDHSYNICGNLCCKDALLIGDKTHAQIALTPIRDKILKCQTFRSILRPSSVAMYIQKPGSSNLVRNAKGW